MTTPCFPELSEGLARRLLPHGLQCLIPGAPIDYVKHWLELPWVHVGKEENVHPDNDTWTINPEQRLQDDWA